jgi:serine/threonine protein phosphatase PrpC
MSFFSRLLQFNWITSPETHTVFEIYAGATTHTGRVRSGNEDCVSFTRPSGRRKGGAIAIVADGMGGCNAGEVASSMACAIIPHIWSREKSGPYVALRKAFETANREILRAATEEPELAGMGTTCVALAFEKDEASLAWVGDSRLYLVRDGQIYRMSEDHTVVNEMVKTGIITKEEANHRADRNVLSRALGTRPKVAVSGAEAIPLRTGDRFLLCSDGLYNLLTDAELLEIVGTEDVVAASKNLIEAANGRGGYDNISAIVIEALDSRAISVLQPRVTREICGSRNTLARNGHI